MDKTNIEDFFIVYSTRDNSLLQFNLKASGAMDEIWMYTHMEDAIKSGVWSTVEPAAGANLDFRDACEVEDADGERRIYAAANDGMLYELFNEDTLSWTDAAGVSYAIESQIGTNWMRLGKEAGGGVDDTAVTPGRIESGLVKPVWVELMVSGGLWKGSEWTVLVETAPGCDEAYTDLAATTASVTLTFDFAGIPTYESMVRIATQNLPPWDFIRYTITNSDLDNDVYLRGMRSGLQTAAMSIPYPK